MNKKQENTPKSLERKTKAQLIDIIFRKDAKEKDLNNVISNLTEKLHLASNKRHIERIDFEKTIDDMTSDYYELLHNYTRIKNTNKLIIVISIFLLLIMIGFNINHIIKVILY
ncbi:MAG: hypothetical protein [crAssphage sp. isolate ctcc615]|uniref:Uncharacterized protein n=1 Tax=crAssphage sp. isolate ctcc615 TaxID=2989853 RepID=A0A345BP03_9CAUD|nr:MAG: hypothetical protein KNU00_gp37 [crAssphage sp. isolate ctcc615]AXF52174.1 MAG: hypothetical protein [crAssphage sp. isolate ctcc615]